MDFGPLIVILLRLIIPVSIFRWPLAGGIISMLLDGADVILIGIIGRGDFSSYATTDKMLDMYYLTFEAVVSLKWKDLLARNTNLFLYLYRFLGVVLFESTKIRLFLFLFPNLFENFYLFYLIWQKIAKKPILTAQRLMIILLILLIPKMAQEYLLHFLEFKPWHWFRTEVLNTPGVN